MKPVFVWVDMRRAVGVVLLCVCGGGESPVRDGDEIRVGVIYYGICSSYLGREVKREGGMSVLVNR